MAETLALFAQFVQQNPLIVIAMFGSSLLANAIQIFAFIADRKRLSIEQRERAHLSQLVATYESVLKLAKEAVSDQNQLAVVKAEIANHRERAQAIDEGARILKAEGERSLVAQAIDYHLDNVQRSYDEIIGLRRRYAALGKLPGLTQERDKAIRREVGVALRRPNQLPRELQFRALLLVLFTFLLPGPADALLGPALLGPFVITFFDVVEHVPWDKVRLFALERFSLLTFLCAFGVWQRFFSVLRALAAGVPVVSDVVSAIVGIVGGGVGLALAFSSWSSLKEEVRAHIAGGKEQTDAFG